MRLKTAPYVWVQSPEGCSPEAFLRHYLQDFEVISLKVRSNQELLKSDPYRFFSRCKRKTMFTNLELTPEFFDLFQAYAPQRDTVGKSIMLSTRAQKSAVHQMTCLPLSIAEWKQEHLLPKHIEALILKGGYPEPFDFLAVIRKTIRNSFPLRLKSGDELKLERFIKEAFKSIGSQVNYSQLAQKVQVTSPTAKAWLEALCSLHLFYFLPAWPHPWGKRIMQAPILLAGDTGMACHFLGIRDEQKMLGSAYFYRLYENLMILEFIKHNINSPHPKKVYYWRESNGHEVPLILEHPSKAIDIFGISTRLYTEPKLKTDLDYFDELTQGRVLSKQMIYGGNKNQQTRWGAWLSWQHPVGN